MSALSFFRKYNVGTNLPLFYFLALALFNFIGTAINSTLYWTDIVFLIITSAPFAFRKRAIILIFGCLMTTVWGYLLLAVTSDLIDYQQGKKYSEPILYFGVGYLFFGSSFALSLLLIASLIFSTASSRAERVS